MTKPIANAVLGHASLVCLKSREMEAPRRVKEYLASGGGLGAGLEAVCILGRYLWTHLEPQHQIHSTSISAAFMDVRA